MTGLGWLLVIWVVAAQVGVIVVAWRLLVWLVRGRNPWREPPRWWWRRGRPASGPSGRTSDPVAG